MMRILKRLAPYAIIVAAAFLLLYLPDVGPERYSDLATFCRVEAGRQGFSGLAIAAVSDGSVLYVDGFGEDGSGAPVGPDTALYAPAAAKPIAALAAYSLSRSGALILDRPVADYVPWFGSVDAAVTVRELIAQASGFTDADFDDAHPSATDLESAARAMIGARPSFRSGEGSAYIDTGYQVLALAMERATGKPYATIARERVFLPLGMKSSDARPLASPPAGSATFFALSIPRPAPASPFGAASSYAMSSASDMGQYMAFLLGPEKFQRGPVSARAARALLDPLFPTSPYGFGLRLAGSSGKRFAYSDGAIDGFSSRIALWPDEKKGIAILASQCSLLQSRFALPAMTEAARRIIAQGSSSRLFPLGRLHTLLAVAAAVNLIVLAFQIGGARGWTKMIKDRAEAKGSRGPLRFASFRSWVGLAVRVSVALSFPSLMTLAFGRSLSWPALFVFEPDISAWLLFACLLGGLRNTSRLAWLRDRAVPKPSRYPA
jgi:CubicO group peptidase (beta-lactamase class C family)